MVVPVRSQPLLVVPDVPAAAKWYATLLGARAEHGGDEYGQVVADGELVLQLHHDGVDHHHGPLADPAVAVGNGVLVWFSVTGFDDAVARSRDMGAEVVTDVHVNPNALQRELWLRDPDGYLVVLSERG